MRIWIVHDKEPALVIGRRNKGLCHVTHSRRSGSVRLPGRDWRSKIELEHQADVDNPHAIVGIPHDRGPGPLRVEDPLGVRHQDPGSGDEHDFERPERLGLDDFS